MKLVLALIFSYICLFSQMEIAVATPIKEWSVLVYMNGNNSLAPYTVKDLNEMEVAGSNANMNVVVQWASRDNSTTKRLFIQKDQDLEKVTSPVVQDLPRIDMGDYRSLIEFVRWSKDNYPAKKYAVIVWNHGTGWHDLPKKDEKPLDGSGTLRRFKRQNVIESISGDDFTKNKINTVQLGVALKAAAKITGSKIELLGADACSMASIEIAMEVRDSIKFYVASEELEDDNGWVYDSFLTRLSQNPSVDGLGLGRIIADTYLESSIVKGNSMGGVTLSITDTSELPGLAQSIAKLSNEIQMLSSEDLYEVWSAADMSQRFWYDTDYKDAGSFIENLVVSGGSIPKEVIQEVKTNLEKAVPYKIASRKYTNTFGLTLWVPPFNLIFDRFIPEYELLEFAKLTGWQNALVKLIRPDQGPY